VDSSKVREWTDHGRIVIDLAGVVDAGELPKGYEGIAW
jgi:hypothetical protein